MHRARRVQHIQEVAVMAEIVLYETRDAVAIITLNRPEALNAINLDLLAALSECIDKAEADAVVRAVVVTGAGAKAFSAGADIAMFHKSGAEEIRRFAETAFTTFARLSAFGAKPSIAAINGYALGGGLELAEACMMRIAVRGAMMGHPEVKIGAVAGWGGTTRMTRLIGPGHAAELLLTGKSIDAEHALRIGLVNRVCEPERLMDEAMGLAREIASLPKGAVALTWEAMQRGLDMGLTDSLMLGAELFGKAAEDGDFREGTGAFIEKRKPKYK